MLAITAENLYCGEKNFDIVFILRRIFGFGDLEIESSVRIRGP
jgi:hypothetical protein